MYSMQLLFLVGCFFTHQSSRMSPCWGSHLVSWQPSNKQQYVFGLVGKEGMTTMEDKGKDYSRDGWAVLELVHQSALRSASPWTCGFSLSNVSKHIWLLVGVAFQLWDPWGEKLPSVLPTAVFSVLNIVPGNCALSTYGLSWNWMWLHCTLA